MPAEYEVTNTYPSQTNDAEGNVVPAITVMYKATHHPGVTGAVTVPAADAHDKVAYSEKVHGEVTAQIEAHEALLARKAHQ